MVEVVTDTFDRHGGARMRPRCAERFRQESIHLRALPVELLDEGNRCSKPFAIVTGASSGIGLAGRVTAMAWIRDRALTLALMAMFLLFLAGQLLTGFAEYNSEQTQHGHTAVALTDYLATGHLWEAIFENWESEFLQMAVFVLLTTFLIQKGSPESRRPGCQGTRRYRSSRLRRRPGRALACQARRLDPAPL